MGPRASLVLIDRRTIVCEHFICLEQGLNPLFSNVLTYHSVSDFIVDYHNKKNKVALLVLGVGTIAYAEESVKVLCSVFKSKVPMVLLDNDFKHAMIKFMVCSDLDGYLSLWNTREDFLEMTKQVLNGKRVVSQEMGKINIVHSNNCQELTWLKAPHFFRLSNRESELFRLLVRGEELYTCSEIMGITVKSAENLKTRLMQKLNVHSTPHLILQGIKLGLGPF